MKHHLNTFIDFFNYYAGENDLAHELAKSRSAEANP
jgi:hypothetical protein